MGSSGYGYHHFASWSRDYPKADRQFLIALNRLTRINGRTTEQVVNLDSDDIFNYPFIYAVQVQNWSFTDEEAKRLREYLMRGGFLMVDDFHGTADWENFMTGMRQALPDRPVEDLQNGDEIFHVLYDMDDRFQVPGEQYIRTGRTYEKDGFAPKWRAIRDDKGRIVVAICHNMHLGDAWEWGRRSQLPRNLRLHGLPGRPQLRRLRDDPLGRFQTFSERAHSQTSAPAPERSASRTTLSAWTKCLNERPCIPSLPIPDRITQESRSPACFSSSSATPSRSSPRANSSSSLHGPRGFS